MPRGRQEAEGERAAEVTTPPETGQAGMELSPGICSWVKPSAGIQVPVGSAGLGDLAPNGSATLGRWELGRAGLWGSPPASCQGWGGTALQRDDNQGQAHQSCQERTLPVSIPWRGCQGPWCDQKSQTFLEPNTHLWLVFALLEEREICP